MTQKDERPDLRMVRRKLAILVTVIAVTVVCSLALVLFLYSRFTTGVQVTP